MLDNEQIDICDLIRKAYKKFKSNTYFDRTNSPVREQIIHFESTPDWASSSDLEVCFSNMKNALLSEDESDWEKYQESILQKIQAFCYPKELEKQKADQFYTTAKQHSVCVKKLQYMIHLPVEGHILGTLWILLYGYQIDQKLYEHTYGNRIRKTLHNELSNIPTYSPHLFEPYFQQYQSWRDTALEDAKKCIQQNCDVVILTLDLARYFYSLDVTPAVMKQIMIDEIEIPQGQELLAQRLSMFIAEVCRVYAQQLPESECKNRSVLPIGFLPSNILSNWFLNRFDQAIADHWNPLYYGRYVDDVLIVSKVESNSDIAKKAQNEELTKNDIIQFFLLQCTKWPGVLNRGECNLNSDYALLQKGRDSRDTYFINPRYLPTDCHCEVSLQNEKINIFYFQRGESDALLECFKQNIGRNVSEFRHMPEDGAIFQRNDYHEIYSLTQKSINKLRDVEDVEVDKFQLSKFLGKYLRIGGMIDDPIEHEFERDLDKIFDYWTVINNYPLWERVAEILVMNEKFEALSRFASRTKEAITRLTVSASLPPEELEKLKNTLYSVQLTGLTKALALCWKPASREFSTAFMKSFQDDSITVATFFDHAIDAKHRAAWLRCRMADKSVMPVLPDLLLAEGADWEEEDFNFWDDHWNINLTRFDDVIKFLSSDANGITAEDRFSYMTTYKYHPYMLTMHELSIAQMLTQLLTHKMPMAADDYRTQHSLYVESNYQTSVSLHASDFIDATSLSFGKQNPVECSLIKAGDGHKETLRIALSNVRLDPKMLIDVLDGRPDRSYQRYQIVSKLINQALDESTDLLIMPEAFLPFEWLPLLARICAKSQMALVTGIEHLVIGTTVYNLTATILPFQEHDDLCAQIYFHLKNHYAPAELSELHRFHMVPPKAETRYELFCWNDCWFSVYCCFELCSIQDRALFQSYIDFLVAVEWNQDINHYGNIIKSLARDMHCYCVQVNEAKYGDSRIVIPTRTEERDLLRIKGGQNPSVLVDEINIKELRDFQFSGHSKIDFKPLPPQFNRDLVDAKRKRILYKALRDKSSY